MRKITTTLCASLLLAAAPTVAIQASDLLFTGIGEMPRPMQTTQTEIVYILPDNCIVPELSTPHALTEDGQVWEFDSKPEKVAKLTEGDSVKISQTSTRGLMIQSDKSLTLSVKKVGECSLEAERLDALCGFIPGVSYVLVGEEIFFAAPIVVEDQQGQAQMIPSICHEWEQGEEVLLGRGDQGLGSLINPDRREMAVVLSMGEVNPLKISEVDGLAFVVANGNEWTVFPNFYASVEEWGEGEHIHGIIDDLEVFFGDPSELDPEYLEAIMEFLGDPGWDDLNDKQMMFGINATHNTMAPLWRQK